MALINFQEDIMPYVRVGIGVTSFCGVVLTGAALFNGLLYVLTFGHFYFSPKDLANAFTGLSYRTITTELNNRN